ncbi:MAG: cellulose binding domain-containing protein [Bacillota bacterium]|nr:cellulose binding domain-containing protein [Bacillota bacterium]
MKKTALILILILAMVTSVMAGTLASYTTTINDVASGSVIGKEFVFLEDGEDSFRHNIKIAPTEKEEWEFTVKNYNGSIITETNLFYKLEFDVRASDGKHAIDPLTVTVKDEDGEVLNSVTGVGKMTVTGEFPLSADGQKSSYTVEIYWPSDDEIDINYAGKDFGTTVNVSAFASQVPFGSGGDPQDPEDPGESDIQVKYQAGEAWGVNGHWDNASQQMVYESYKHNFKVTITNNSDEAISNWEIEFLLNEAVENYWNAVQGSGPSGGYKFEHPANYNQNIGAGESVSFGGTAEGSGSNPISSVKVNGKAADTVCEYNVPTSVLED